MKARDSDFGEVHLTPANPARKLPEPHNAKNTIPGVENPLCIFFLVNTEQKVFF